MSDDPTPDAARETMELKPCPFCGSSSVSLCGETLAFYVCDSCEAEGPIVADWDPNAARLLWNRRAAAMRASPAGVSDELKAQAGKHALDLEQCSLFVETDYSELIAKGMRDAAEFIRSRIAREDAAPAAGAQNSTPQPEYGTGTRNELPATDGRPVPTGRSARDNQHSDDGRLAFMPGVEASSSCAPVPAAMPGREEVDNKYVGQDSDPGALWAEIVRLRALLPAPQPVAGEPSQGLRDIAAERRRQIEQEGWTPEHDDSHVDGQLALAAVCYALPEYQQIERLDRAAPPALKSEDGQ